MAHSATRSAATFRWRHLLLLSYLGLVAGCCMEIAPGWEPLELGWSFSRFMLLVAIGGAIVGYMMSEQYWLPGLISGPVIGTGSLATVAWHLSLVPATNSVFILLLALAGTIPGWLLFTALRLWQASVTSAAERTTAPQS